MDQRIGRYRILGQLGRGAMGVVYLAEDPTLNRQVAIKMVDVSVDDASEKEFLRSRLLRDARAAAALTHPNIVTVYDVIEEDGKAYVVMEYIAGESLSAWLKKTPIPNAAFTLRVLRDMASALDYTHGRDIIHRDIKPSNVMIDPRESAKIMDFGIARFHDAHGGTVTGMVMGTIEYMAPEQVKGEPLDGHADQFALAAVAYQMLSGSTLFGQHSFTTLAYKLVNEQPPPACTRNAALPPRVDAVLSKALSKSPRDRFATCTQFVEELAAAFAGGVSAAEETTRVLPVPVAPSKRKFSVAVAAILGILILGAAGWLFWKPRASQPTPDGKASVIPTPVQPTPAPATVQPAELQKEPPAASQLSARAAVSRPPAEKQQPEEEPPPDLDEPSAPGPAAELYNRAQDQIKNGQYDGAVQSLNKAIAIRADFAKAFLSRGMAHQHLDQTEAALDDYSTVIRLRPRKPLAYYERGICHARLQDNDLALADYDRALQLKPDMHLALNARGMVYLKKKQFEKAIADFKEAIRLAPNFGPAYQNRGRAKQAMGDKAGARADMDKAAELMGHHSPASHP
jgi:serine/threonine protein kinase/Flp pilus assembly protein TadD